MKTIRRGGKVVTKRSEAVSVPKRPQSPDIKKRESSTDVDWEERLRRSGRDRGREKRKGR